MFGNTDEQPIITPRKRLNAAVPALVLWAVAVTFGLFFVSFEGELFQGYGSYYLIPWSLLAGIVLAAPSLVIFYRGNFDLFHPLVYGIWTYMFPAFVLGGIILAFGLSNHYFISFIQDPEYNIPLSLFYIVVGYLSVVAGFYFPFMDRFTRAIGSKLPDWDWKPENIWLPGLALMAFGVGFNILGFVQGVLGYQSIKETGLLDGLVFYLTVIFNIGSLLLWLAIFTSKNRNATYYLVLAILCVSIPLKMALQGSRGSLLLSVLPIAMAYWYSGRRVKWQHGAAFAGVLFLAISIGIVYGTSFRNIKGSEARVNAGDYIGQIAETIDYLGRTDPGKLFVESTETLFERIENLSSLAVVVSNYEALEVYEESYGLKDNIYNDLVTAFIPRFVWPDKPSTSDPRRYSDLYFNYGENSFAITPFGDLLRNFGFIGIPLGMLIVGIYLRLIYSTLIATDRPLLWKKAAYFPLLTVVSYEAFYATMFPSLIRIVIILLVSLVFVSLLAGRESRRTSF